MKYLRDIITVAMMLLCIGACTAQTKTDDMKQQSKALIVFFSHTGENYIVGNIKEGNTKIVADYIKEVTGANTFEIVPEKSYQMPYNDLIKVAQDETNRGELPPFRGSVDNIDEYDTIFIGGPIWWGTYPQVMFTFFDQYDLGNKTIIPFTTHEGSGLASTVDDLRRIYPNANIKGAFAIRGHEVRSNKDKVVKWLQSIGY